MQLSKSELSAAKKLNSMAQKNLDTMEYRTVTIKGVKNLSHSDVDEIARMTAQAVQTGYNPYASYLSPSSQLQAVYDKAGVGF